MFDKRIVTKTYKFIYINRSGSTCDDRGFPNEIETLYTFGNVPPKDFPKKSDRIFSHSKFSYRMKLNEFFRSEELAYCLKASEPVITRAMVKHWMHEVKKTSAEIAKFRKSLQNKKYDATALEQIRLSLSLHESNLQGYKAHLKQWRSQYKQLDKMGVYTWLELTA